MCAHESSHRRIRATLALQVSIGSGGSVQVERAIAGAWRDGSGQRSALVGGEGQEPVARYDEGCSEASEEVTTADAKPLPLGGLGQERVEGIERGWFSDPIDPRDRAFALRPT